MSKDTGARKRPEIFGLSNLAKTLTRAEASPLLTKSTN